MPLPADALPSSEMTAVDVAPLPLLEDDALVYEPPTLADACDPAGSVFDVTAPPPPKVVRAQRSRRGLALLISSLFAAVLGGAVLCESTYTFGWVEDDGRLTVIDLAPHASWIPFQRASVVVDEDADVVLEPTPTVGRWILPERDMVLFRNGGYEISLPGYR